MKIALVEETVFRYASGDSSAVGGAERYLWLLTRALAAHGWPAIVGVRDLLEPGKRVRIEGVDFVGIDDRGHFLLALYRFLASERPEWCLWFGATHLLGPAAAIGRLTGTKTLFGAQFDLDVQPREALYRRPRLWPLFALGLAGSTRIFLQHGDQYARLPARWRSKASIIPGVVSVPNSFTPHEARKKTVAWVGVLRQPKRPDLLVEIARRLPSVEFIICGGASNHRSPAGYGERMIEELMCLPNVRYAGQVAPATALEIIANSAVLLSTSEREGFPSVFVEAWAHGTPVVSLTIDPDRIIEEKGLGLMAGGVDGAVKGIPALLESSARRQDMALRAREHVGRFHTGTSVARLVERVLEGASASVLQPYRVTGEP